MYVAQGFPEEFENFCVAVSRLVLLAKYTGSNDMKYLLTRFAADELGATAIEYGLIAAGIAVAIITVVQNLGSKLNTTFGTVKNGLK